MRACCRLQQRRNLAGIICQRVKDIVLQNIVETTHSLLCVFLKINEFADLEPPPFKQSTMWRKILKWPTQFPMIVFSRGSCKPNQWINHRAQSFNTFNTTIFKGIRSCC